MSENSGRPDSASAVVGLVIIVALGWWGYNTWFKPSTWQGLYELPTDNIIHATQPFDSREQCEGWLNSRFTANAYNKECGSGCKPPSTAIGSYVCEETFN